MVVVSHATLRQPCSIRSIQSREMCQIVCVSERLTLEHFGRCLMLAAYDKTCRYLTCYVSIYLNLDPHERPLIYVDRIESNRMMRAATSEQTTD